MNYIENFGKLKSYTDDRGGSLIPIEFKQLNFIPKRIFTVTGVPKDHVRGEHAHYTTRQILICLEGKILVGLDDGIKLTETILNPGEYIYIENYIWDYQKFLTGNDVMVVLASTEYDPNDYINDKNDFYRVVKK